MESLIEKVLVSSYSNETWDHNGFIARLVIIFKSTLWRLLFPILLWLSLLKNVVLVDLEDSFCLSSATGRARFQILETVAIGIRFTFLFFAEVVDSFDFIQQSGFELSTFSCSIHNSCIGTLQTRLSFSMARIVSEMSDLP